MRSSARSCASARVKPTSPALAVITWARCLRADMRAHAADIDNAACAALLQRRQAGFAAMKGAVERDVEHGAPIGVRHLVERLFAAQRRVVDQNIDPLEMRKRSLGQRLRGLGIGDVADMGGGLAAGFLDFADDAVRFRFVRAHIHQHRRARLRQRQRDRAPDIAPGAGDDGDFAGKFLFAHQPLHSSCPALCRASTSFFISCRQGVDGRDKPGHDGQIIRAARSNRLAHRKASPAA